MRDDFYLTDEQRGMRELVRAIARDRIAPRAAYVDEAESYPLEQLEWLGGEGLMGLHVPEAYGGPHIGAPALCLPGGGIAPGCAPPAPLYLVHYAGGPPLRLSRSEGQTRPD